MRARDTGAAAGTDTIALLMQLDFYWSISSGRSVEAFYGYAQLGKSIATVGMIGSMAL